jgi:hypothetical protein
MQTQEETNSRPERGCQMYFFRPKIAIWVSFGEELKMKMLLYFVEYLQYCAAMLRTFGIFSGNLEHILLFWYVVPGKIWQPWALESLALGSRNKNESVFSNYCLFRM